MLSESFVVHYHWLTEGAEGLVLGRYGYLLSRLLSVFQANSTSDPGRDLLQSPCVQPPSRCGEILSLWIPLSPPSHPISHWSDWFVQLTELIVAFSFSLWFFDLCLMILFFISLVSLVHPHYCTMHSFLHIHISSWYLLDSRRFRGWDILT